ncbi:ABC transporter permease subunit [Thermococcus sp. JCM 11816]|uniref:ABC transporter permease subunit n=1 Tax=Thermococcus sp. (strain JCM 11816 / KS-1) TaxID=1295125 RepID=UPI000ABB4563
MHWGGLKLEFIKSMRTKKVWVLLGIMMLLYVPGGFYLEKMNGNTPQTVGEAVNMLVSNIEDLAGFFLGILALLLGATAINSDLENGTIRVALSKPVRRIGYLGGASS